jgi:hypothetical protein
MPFLTANQDGTGTIEFFTTTTGYTGPINVLITTINNNYVFNNILITDLPLTFGLTGDLLTEDIQDTTVEVILSIENCAGAFLEVDSIYIPITCTDPVTAPINLIPATITDNSIQVFYNNQAGLTPKQLFVTNTVTNTIILNIFVPINSSQYTITNLDYDTNYTIEMVVTNCFGILSEIAVVNTKIIVNTSVIFARLNTGVLNVARSSSTNLSYLATLPTIALWTSSQMVNCLTDLQPITTSVPRKIYSGQILNTNGFAHVLPNPNTAVEEAVNPVVPSIGKGVFCCCTPGSTPQGLLTATLSTGDVINQEVFQGKYLGITPTPQSNNLQLNIIISKNNSGGHANAGNLELYLVIDGVTVINGVIFNQHPTYINDTVFHTVIYNLVPTLPTQQGVIEAYVYIRNSNTDPFNPSNRSSQKLWYEVLSNI